MPGLEDLKNNLLKAANLMNDGVPIIIEAEGKSFIQTNFRNQGFTTDTGVEKWKPRKTTDRDGRDITRYRTDRHGTKGALTKFGRENQGRAILVGHNTGGNKLKNSFRTRREKGLIIFTSYKIYAERHNEGKDGMPMRKFIGKSTYLDGKIKTKITKELDKIFK